MSILIELSKNKAFTSTLIAWALAQTIKVMLGVITERRFNFKWFVGTGGMPSSHSAGGSALATSVGIILGFDTPLFAIAAIFALITMFDAQGVRRATGHQAEILNKIMDDIYSNKGVQEEKLKELVGHTPVQVFVGALIGIGVAILNCL